MYRIFMGINRNTPAFRTTIWKKGYCFPLISDIRYYKWIAMAEEERKLIEYKLLDINDVYFTIYLGLEENMDGGFQIVFDTEVIQSHGFQILFDEMMAYIKKYCVVETTPNTTVM